MKNEVETFFDGIIDCITNILEKLEKIEDTFFNEVFCDHYDSDDTILDSDDEEIPSEVLKEIKVEVPEEIKVSIIEEDFQFINEDDLV